MSRWLFALLVLTGMSASIGRAHSQERQENADSESEKIISVGNKPAAQPNLQTPVVVPDDAPDVLMRISKTLDKRVRFEFRDIPLKDVILQFETAFDIEIDIDQKAFTEDGITDDSPVTAKSSGLTFRSALRMILKPWQLTWTTQNETLVITTATKAAETRHRKIYDVTDLVTVATDAPNQNPQAVGNRATLMRAIVDNTGGPIVGEWTDDGGDGRIEPLQIAGLTLFVVNQTQEALDEIDELLADLRKTLKAAK